MGTMIYTPGVQVHIQTAGHGIVDVTDDLEGGTLTIQENQSASFSFSLTNHRRKYDGVFTPNDTVSVQMKRLRWVLVFSGYLNQVPYFSVYPRSIQLTANDSLKRLRYRLWDPGAPASVTLLNGGTLKDSSKRSTETDGGLRDILMELLQKVAGWPAMNMHIGRIPDDWATKMAAIQKEMGPQIAVDTSALGLDGATFGVAAGSAGSTTAGSTVNSSGADKVRLRTNFRAGASTPDAAPKGTGIIPLTRGIATATPESGSALLTGESYADPRDPFYCDMQFGFGDLATLGTAPGQGFSRAEYIAAKQWWSNRLILLTSPKTNQSVVVRAAGWGPLPFSDAKVAVSPQAFNAIGAKEGDVLIMGFAPDGSRIGPVKSPEKKAPLPPFSPPSPTVPDTVFGGTTSEGYGERLTSDDNLQQNVSAARTFVLSNWILPYGVGGYSPRSISGLSVEADHYRGQALDVIVAEPGTQAVGDDLAKGNAIAEWFVNNAVVYGTDFVIWQDLINYGSGWGSYGKPVSTLDDTEQHRDHVHISFHPPFPTIPGDPADYLPNPYNDPGYNGVQDPKAVT